MRQSALLQADLLVKQRPLDQNGRSGARLPWHPLPILGVWLSLMIGVVLTSAVAGLVAAGLGILLGSLLIRSRLGLVARALSGVWPFVLLTALLHYWLTPRGLGNSIEFLNYSLDIHKVEVAAFFTGRLLLILMGTTIAFTAIEARHCARELGRVASRIPGFRRVSSQIELILMISIRFIPLVAEEARRLQLVLRARGYPLANGPVSRLRRLRKIVFPLLVAAFRRADQMAVALVARGYDSDHPRSYWHVSRLQTRDLLSAVGFATLFLAAPLL